MSEQPTNDNPFAAPEHGVPQGVTSSATTAAGATTDGQGSYIVEFELQVEDLVSFQIHHWKTTPALRRQRLLQRYFSPAVLLAIGCTIFAFDRGDAGILFLIMFAAIALVIAFYSREANWRRLMDRNLRKFYAQGKNRNLFGWHRVTIDAVGYHGKSQYSESIFRWPAIERVDVAPQHVLIYLSSAYSVLIPKLAFRDQGQLDAFVEAARRYHREAEQQHG